MALIGPAGEKLVRFACVVNELKHANGRTGMGAVMGSKNLKAIAVRGTNKLEVKDLEKFLEMSKSLTELIGQHGPEQGPAEAGDPKPGHGPEHPGDPAHPEFSDGRLSKGRRRSAAKR